jgi:H+/Cl- antiporter ClcA
MVATGWLALALMSAVTGTWVSARFPTRPPERGLGRRSPGGAVGIAALLGTLVAGGVLILAVLAVRSLTPDPYDELASVIVTSLAACVAAGVWWIGLERNADVVEQSRERMIDTLAKSPDA